MSHGRAEEREDGGSSNEARRERSRFDKRKIENEHEDMGDELGGVGELR